MDVKPRNYVYNANQESTVESEVIAHAFTPNMRSLISVDSLDDPLTQVKVRNLKIWKRRDDTEYDVVQYVNLYDFDSDNIRAIAVDDSTFALSNGTKVQVWSH